MTKSDPPGYPSEYAEKGKPKSGSIPKTNEDSNWPKLDRVPVTSQTEVPVEGNKLLITNIEKVYWHHPDITKGHLLNYYVSMADYILPYLKDRPLSLHFKHVAVNAPGLYQKDMEDRTPAFAEVFRTERLHPKRGKRNVIDYLVCNNLSTLIYIVNLSAIDINPWSSRTASPKEADYLVIDIDPSDNDFSKAVEATLAAKHILDNYNLKACVKTSGKTGIHIVIPCSGIDYKSARAIGTTLADEIHGLVPAITTRIRDTSHRGDLVYIDDSQNDFADTIACPYSVRPFKLPMVSTPLEWKEVKAGLDSTAFNINTIEKRVKRKGDLFRGLMDPKIADANNRVLKLLL